MPVDKFGRMSDAEAVYTEGVSLRYINNNFLRRDGTNTATGSINMTGNTLTNVSNPVIDQDVATKNYVDTNSSSDKVSKSGDTMTGHLNMSGNLIIGLPTTYPPITYVGDEATSWDQTVGLVQDAANILVDKSGDTMTGNLDMSGNRVMNVPYAPVNTSDAANAAYVIQGDLDVEQKTVLRDGTQAMTGNLDMSGNLINNLSNPLNAQDAATKAYADTRLSTGGGTMTGIIYMSDNRITGLSDPINNQDAATKWYVDNNSSMALTLSTPTTAIFKQPLLDIGLTLANIPLIAEGTMMSGIILADPINIHITTGGLFRLEVCGNCVAPRQSVLGICPEGLIRVETSTHTICWTPIGGHRDTSFSRFAYYRIASNETVSLKCQKTGAENRILKVSVWLTIERV